MCSSNSVRANSRLFIILFRLINSCLEKVFALGPFNISCIYLTLAPQSEPSSFLASESNLSLISCGLRLSAPVVPVSGVFSGIIQLYHKQKSEKDVKKHLFLIFV